jgi:hypothetical protein
MKTFIRLSTLVWLVFGCVWAHGQFPPPIIHSPFTTNSGPMIDAKNLSVTNLDLASATNFSSSIYGRGANVVGTNSLAVGPLSFVNQNNAVAIGPSASALTNNPGDFGGVAIGPFATNKASVGVAIGYFSFSTNAAVAVGAAASAKGDSSFAMGTFSSASQPFSMAVGPSATALASNTLAFGFLASVNQANSTALGQRAATTDTNQIMLGIANGTVVVPGQFIGAGTVSNSFRLVPTNGAAGVIYNPTNDTLSASGKVNIGGASLGGSTLGVNGMISMLGGSYQTTDGPFGKFGGADIYYASSELLVRSLSDTQFAADGDNSGNDGGFVWKVGTQAFAGGTTNMALSPTGDLIIRGGFGATNNFRNLPTNQAPTSVTIGVTVPDAWVWFTNSGTAYAMPAWKNH